MQKILVIDDDPFVRSTIVKILERQGYQVLTAADGARGLSVYRSERPDLVITDIIMPEKEGIETISDIRKECPTAPIIATSGGGRRGAFDFLAIAKKFGASETLQKPFEPEDLVNSVVRCLAAA